MSAPSIPWREVRAEMLESGQVSEEGLAQARAEREAFVVGYRLAELRRHLGIAQVQVAKTMGVSQSRVSAMEHGNIDSLTIASVRAYVDALGGTVRLVASVDDTDVNLRLPAA